MSAITELKERRSDLAEQIERIDSVLRLLGGTVKRARGKVSANGARSEAAKRMWAARRKAAEAKPKGKVQAKRAAAHPRQSVVPQKPQGASLAAAAEG